MKDSAFFSNKESLDHLQEQMVYQKLSETVRQTYLSQDELKIAAGEYLFLCPKVLLWESSNPNFK